MKYLEEQGLGLDVGVGGVPIVPAAALFDLAIGNPKVHPYARMGYLAATLAKQETYRTRKFWSRYRSICGKAERLKTGNEKRRWYGFTYV
jgi:hypothetical protein